MFVHVSGTCYSILLTMGNDSKKLVLVTDVEFSEIFNVASLFVLSNLEVILADVEEISNFLHVKLEDGNL